MTVTQERNREIVERFGSGPGDTGRTEVQIALLTERIAALTEHLRVHTKTTTPAGGFSCWSGTAAGCSRTYSARTSSATGR